MDSVHAVIILSGWQHLARWPWRFPCSLDGVVVRASGGGLVRRRSAPVKSPSRFCDMLPGPALTLATPLRGGRRGSVRNSCRAPLRDSFARAARRGAQWSPRRPCRRGQFAQSARGMGLRHR